MLESPVSCNAELTLTIKNYKSYIYNQLLSNIFYSNMKLISEKSWGFLYYLFALTASRAFFPPNDVRVKKKMSNLLSRAFKITCKNQEFQ